MSPGISTRLLATQSDERLLALVRQGHERAFEALVHRYRRPLLSYCRRLAPESRAEDVLQQALLKTWIALRDGAEVRDLKAWLYRVVHNTAVNAVRDAAHDSERLADPTLRAGAGQVDVERGLVLREALAEVAALPRLQREVIVRTAVGGYSHEQVASDLGITDGAVRGLLYRARATLRTAVTALTPPPLLTWLGGRVEQSGPAPERLGELAAGGGAVAGFGGLLAKSGVAILAVGTLVTGAAAVHIPGSVSHRAPVKVAAVSGASSASGARASSGGLRAASSSTSSSRVRADGHRQRRRLDGQLRAGSKSPGSTLTTASAGRGSDRSTSGSGGRAVAPISAPTSSGTTSPNGSAPSTGSAQGTGSTQGSSGQAEGAAGQGGGSGAQSSPAGSAASSGSGPEGSSAPSSGDAEAPTGDESSDSSSPSGSSSSGASEAEGSGGQGASGSSGSSGGEQSGGVVGTVVHEVGSLLEHLLH
jgi:RNA polymerase sigma factor (sigma-70 family)